MTFADALGAAKHQEDSEVTSKNEAKKLAFYLFWNIKPSFNRCASFVLKRLVGSLYNASLHEADKQTEATFVKIAFFMFLRTFFNRIESSQTVTSISEGALCCSNGPCLTHLASAQFVLELWVEQPLGKPQRNALPSSV